MTVNKTTYNHNIKIMAHTIMFTSVKKSHTNIKGIITYLYGSHVQLMKIKKLVGRQAKKLKKKIP